MNEENQNPQPSTENVPPTPINQPVASPPLTASQNYASGLYWRKNLWNGTATVPVVMQLKDGLLTMIDRDGQSVFSLPVNTVSARITAFGTLILNCNGTRYAITGRGSAISKNFSSAQKAMLSKQNRATNIERVGAAGMVAGTVLGAAHMSGPALGADAVAEVALGTEIAMSDKTIGQWGDILRQAGAGVKGKRPHELRNLLIITVLIIVVFLIIATIAGSPAQN